MLLIFSWLLVAAVILLLDVRETLRGNRQAEGLLDRLALRVLAAGLVIFSLYWLRPLYE